VAAVVLAEIGDIAWFTKFSQLRSSRGSISCGSSPGSTRGSSGSPKCGRGLLRWALYHAAIGAARTAAFKAKRRGDRFAGFKAIVELAAKQLRVIWGVWRSGTPYDPTRTGGLRRQLR